MPELTFSNETLKSDSQAERAMMEHSRPAHTGMRPRRWKLRLHKKQHEEDKDKKKKKKGKKKKQDSPPPEEEEYWELGPTLAEMRQGALEKFYEDVRERARLLLEYRKLTGVRRPVDPAVYLRALLEARDIDEISSLSSILTDTDLAMVRSMYRFLLFTNNSESHDVKPISIRGFYNSNQIHVLSYMHVDITFGVSNSQHQEQPLIMTLADMRP